MCVIILLLKVGADCLRKISSDIIFIVLLCFCFFYISKLLIYVFITNNYNL